MSIAQIIILILGINFAVGFFILGSLIKSGQFEEEVNNIFKELNEVFTLSFLIKLVKTIIVSLGLLFLILEIIDWVKLKR